MMKAWSLSLDRMKRAITPLRVRAVAGLLGLALHLGSAPWASAQSMCAGGFETSSYALTTTHTPSHVVQTAQLSIPLSDCDAAKSCGEIKDLGQKNCDTLYNPNTQVWENSNCVADVDFDYIGCLRDYCNNAQYEILRN